MKELDETVVGEVARQMLDRVRPTGMFDADVQSTAAQADAAKALLAKLRHGRTEMVAGDLAPKLSCEDGPCESCGDVIIRVARGDGRA
jgi:hypothetical protein